MTNGRLRTSGHRLIVVLVCLCAIAPVAWMALSSLTPSTELARSEGPLLPTHLTIQHFSALYGTTAFGRQLLNTVAIVLGTLLVVIPLSTTAAYSLSRFDYRGKNALARATLVAYMFAPIMLVVPIFALFRRFGLTDSHIGLVLASTTFSLPLAIWLLRGFFVGIPISLEEAGLVDGANRMQVLVFIVVPAAFPGIIAAATFTLIQVFNEYLFARVLISTSTRKTATVGLQDLATTGTDWGMVMAAATSMTVPALIFYVFVQRYLIAGWGSGGVKG